MKSFLMPGDTGVMTPVDTASARRPYGVMTPGCPS